MPGCQGALRSTLRCVKKTSVYLPDGLKQALTEAADRAGCSEAELIRLAIEAAVHQSAKGVPPARMPAPRRGGPLLVGVGVGPGPADLLTVRAIEEISRADVIAAASISAQAIGRAEAVMRAGVGPLRVLRLEIDVSGSAIEREASVVAAAERLVEHLDRGEVVSFLTLGDPNMFSVFPSVAAAVLQRRPSVPVCTVPGVMAFQELAARSGTVIGDENVSVRIIAIGGAEAEAVAASICDSMTRVDETLVLYRGGWGVPLIAEALVAAGRAEGAVVGELLGLPGERWAAASEFLDEPASYLATMIAPAVRRA